MVTEDGLDLGGGHTVPYPDLVTSKCALETFMILSTNVTPINLINLFLKNEKSLKASIYSVS